MKSIQIFISWVHGSDHSYGYYCVVRYHAYEQNLCHFSFSDCICPEDYKVIFSIVVCSNYMLSFHQRDK